MKTGIRAGLILVVVVTLGTQELRAEGYTGLMVIRDGGEVLGVDAQSGAAQSLGQINQPPWEYIHASTYDPMTNKIYLGWSNGNAVGDIFTLNPETFEIESQAALRWARPNEFCYDSLRDRVLVTSGYQEFHVWQIDPANGEQIGIVARLSAGLGSNSGIAYVPGDDSLYVFRQWGDQDKLVRYSIQTGDLTTVREGAYWNQQGFGEIGSLCYNPVDGYIYAIDGVSHKLGRIDPATGLVTALGPAEGYADARSVIYVPEPASLLLVSVGGLAVLRRRWTCTKPGRSST